jgi:YihY family inner membrane protein
VVQPIDSSLRVALRNKSTATTGLILSIFIAFYGTTGVLESMRRALNVAFRVEGGRSFLRRKTVDVASTFVLMTLVLTTMVFVVVGEELAVELFDLIGLDRGAATLWAAVRWPAAVISAMLGFSFIYYVTPDYKHRAFHLVTPGAVLGVSAWLLVSYLLSQYISNVVNVGALYGAFTGAIVVVIWLWLSSCALLFGAELNAAIADEADAVLETGGPEVVGTGHPELVATEATAGADAATASTDEATPGTDGATAGTGKVTARTDEATPANGAARPEEDERAEDSAAATRDDRPAADDEAEAPPVGDDPPRAEPPSGPPCP